MDYQYCERVQNRSYKDDRVDGGVIFENRRQIVLSFRIQTANSLRDHDSLRLSILDLSSRKQP